MPVTLTTKSPRDVVPGEMVRVVIVGVVVLAGKVADAVRVTAASLGAPVRIKEMLLGRPVRDEPVVRLTVTV